MSEQETATHPVYEDLATIEQKHEVNESAQKAITKVLIGENTLWRELSQKNAVEVVADIQANGFEKVQQWALRGWQKDPSEKTKSQESAIEANGRVTSMSHFTDSESGEVIEMTEDYMFRAHEVQGFISGSFYLLAEGLAAMADEKLYGAFGYESFREYCQNELDFGVRQAYRYAVIGRSISPHISSTGRNPNEGYARLKKVGQTKLGQIIKEAEDQVQSLIKEGKINIGEKELTDDQIANMTVKRLRSELASVEEKAAKAELLEEKLRGKEIENEALAEKKNRLEQWKAEHQERAESQDEIGMIIEEVSKLQHQAATLLAKLEPEDMFTVASEAQQEQLVAVLKTAKDRVAGQCNTHLELIETVSERQIDL